VATTGGGGEPNVVADTDVPLTVAVLQRQFAAAVRSALRPASYLGVMRELMLTYVHAATYPLGFLPPAPSQELPTDVLSRRPVLLVHGWVHNRSAFLLMQHGLRRAGLGPIQTYEYPSFSGDLDAIAHRLAPVVEDLVAQADGRSCVLIGHSMGGLVARQYVQELGGHRHVDTVVTMGTPHRGTLSAYLGIGPAVAQCRPGSLYLRRLERTARPGPTRWIAYYSDLDFMITPAVSAKLTHPALGATNVRVRDTGHLSMLLSPSVLADLVLRLEADAEAGASTSRQTRTSGA
jgi:pimeloyl-ACP methyl ester carboxylesterase